GTEDAPNQSPPDATLPGRWNSQCAPSGAKRPDAPGTGPAKCPRLRIQPAAWKRRTSLHYSQRSPPSRLIKEVQHHMRQEANAVAHVGFAILVRGRLKRPVDEHRPPNNIFLRNKPPISAVQAYVAVVAHAEVTARRHHQKIIAIRIRILRRVLRVDHIRFLQLLAIAIYHPVTQANVVPRHAHDPLHHIQPRLARRQKYHDVAALHLPVGKQRSHPGSLRRELNAVHKHVIPNQQSVLHRAGRDLERLHHKRDDEQPRHQHGRQRGKKFHRCFAWLFFYLYFILRVAVFFRHRDLSVPSRLPNRTAYLSRGEFNSPAAGSGSSA